MIRIQTPLFATVAALAGLASVPAASHGSDAVVLYSAGIDGILNDSKDTALHAALVMMQQNGLSLPPGQASHQEEHAANLFVDVLLSQMDLRLSVHKPGPSTGDMPFGLVVSSRGNAGTTPKALVDDIHELARLDHAPRPVPAPDYPGFMTISDTGQGKPKMWIGTQDHGGHSTAAMSINTPPVLTDVDWSGCGVPSGIEPCCGVVIDFGAMSSVLAMASMMAPGADSMLAEWGLIGPKPIKIEGAAWRGGDSIRVGGRISNYGVHFGDLLTKDGIRNQDLSVVPADAVAMQVSRFNISGMCDSMLKSIDGMAGSAMGGDAGKKPMKPSEAMCMQAKQMVGINPKTELIDYLGDTVVAYRSRSTGGDGLMSGVLLAKLSNADGMATSLGILAARLNAMVSPMSQGYAQMLSWSHADCGEVISITFPGVPIPLELSMVVKGDWLVMTLNPQAMVAACRQLDASSSVLNNPRFAKAVGRDAIGAMQVNFTDLPAQLDRGYGIAVGIMSAISNYTRPRQDAGAGVSMIMPPYADLVEGAEPCALIARMSGEDLVYTGSSDSSINVLITGASANVTAMLPLAVPLMLGVALPAMDNAREAAVKARELARNRMEHNHNSGARHPQETLRND